jgi:crotonobetainyl-CoA:carnitine CoA-transferase CaiB-like acyl-CoA transferase
MDVALTESVLGLMETLLPEYGGLRRIRQPTGSRLPTAAPSSAYPCSEGKWILIAANSEPLFAKLCDLIDRPELVDDPRFKGNQARLKHVQELDRIFGEWSSTHTAAEADRILTEADVPCTQIYTAAEIATDPQFRARGMVRDIDDPIVGHVLHPGVVPVVPEDPGQIRWTGPAIGAHTEEVLRELLDMTQAEVAELRQDGAI